YIGKWKGLFLCGHSVILSYLIDSTEIFELPGSIKENHITAFTRTFKVSESRSKLFINIAEVLDGRHGVSKGQVGHLFHESPDITTTVILKGTDGNVKVIDNRYMVVELPPADEAREFTIFMRKGNVKDTADFKMMTHAYKEIFPDFKKG